MTGNYEIDPSLLGRQPWTERVVIDAFTQLENEAIHPCRDTSHECSATPPRETCLASVIEATSLELSSKTQRKHLVIDGLERLEQQNICSLDRQTDTILVTNIAEDVTR